MSTPTSNGSGSIVSPAVIAAVRDCLSAELGTVLPAPNLGNQYDIRVAALGGIAESIVKSPALLAALSHFDMKAISAIPCSSVAQFTGQLERWDLGIVVRPFKTQSKSFVSDPSPSVVTTGTVDTVVKWQAGTLGVNTNFWGIIAALRALCAGPGPAIALLLGAGSSARAAGFAVKRLWPNSRLVVSNRNPKAATELSEALSSEAVTPSSTPGVKADLIINGTSWGDTPASESQTFAFPLDGLLVPGCSFLDVNIRRSRLQDQALARGCTVVSGTMVQFVTQTCRAALVRRACDQENGLG